MTIRDISRRLDEISRYVAPIAKDQSKEVAALATAVHHLTGAVKELAAEVERVEAEID